MLKWLMSIFVLAASVLGVATLIANTPASPEELAQEAASQLKIVATNYQFDQEVYEVEQGSTLNVVLDNKEGFHGIEIKGMDIKLEGNELSKEITFDTPGEYEVVCSVLCGTGHADMKSIIVVK